MLLHASSTPAAGTVPDEWENRAREVFLDGNLARSDPNSFPPGDDPTQQLLSVFELEKTVCGCATSATTGPSGSRRGMTGIRLRDS